MPATPPARRVLVKEVNWLGDLVMSLPALRAIRRAWPDAHLSVLVKHELASFFDGARWIDEVMPYSIAVGVRGLADSARLVSQIRAGGFDVAILFPNSFSSALWVALAGVPNRAGYIRDARGPLLTHGAAPDDAALGAHQAHHWLAMIRDTLGIDGDAHGPDRIPAIDVHDPHRIRMREWLALRRRRSGHAMVAIAPGATYGPAKEWPAKNYADVIDVLGTRFEAECVLLGALDELGRCEEVARRSRCGAIVAAGSTTVGELAALVSLCDGFIGNDSGCAHVAAALQVPSVAIFGSTDPKRTGPLGARSSVVYRAIECSPCLARTCRFGHYNCLKSIEPEEVVTALTGLGALDRPGQRER